MCSKTVHSAMCIGVIFPPSYSSYLVGITQRHLRIPARFQDYVDEVFTLVCKSNVMSGMYIPCFDL